MSLSVHYHHTPWRMKSCKVLARRLQSSNPLCQKPVSHARLPYMSLVKHKSQHLSIKQQKSSLQWLQDCPRHVQRPLAGSITMLLSLYTDIESRRPHVRRLPEAASIPQSIDAPCFPRNAFFKMQTPGLTRGETRMNKRKTLALPNNQQQNAPLTTPVLGFGRPVRCRCGSNRTKRGPRRACRRPRPAGGHYIP